MKLRPPGLLVQPSPRIRGPRPPWRAHTGAVRALTRDPRITVVAEAGDGIAALELAGDLQPDVVVLELCLARLGGTVLFGRLRAELPHVRRSCSRPASAGSTCSARWRPAPRATCPRLPARRSCARRSSPRRAAARSSRRRWSV